MGDLYKNSHHKVLKYNHHTFASIYLQHASLLFFHNLYDLPLRGAFLNHLLFTIHHLPLLFTIDYLPPPQSFQKWLVMIRRASSRLISPVETLWPTVSALELNPAVVTNAACSGVMPASSRRRAWSGEKHRANIHSCTSPGSSNPASIHSTASALPASNVKIPDDWRTEAI